MIFQGEGVEIIQIWSNSGSIKAKTKIGVDADAGFGSKKGPCTKIEAALAKNEFKSCRV